MNERQDAVRTTFLKYANKPFEYGVVDCCLFAADVAKNLTGVDYTKNFKHKNLKEAVKHLKKYGGLEGLVTHILGQEPTGVEVLQVGDPVLLQLPGMDLSLGIYMDSHAISKTEQGTLQVPPQFILRGWALWQKQ